MNKQTPQDVLGTLGFTSVVKHYQRLMKEHDQDAEVVELILDDHDFFWINMTPNLKQQVRRQVR